MTNLADVLSHDESPALLLGNGINLFSGGASSWESLLDGLADQYGVEVSKEVLDRMLNTERFDIIELTQKGPTRARLQADVCRLMKDWEPSDQHRRIIGWAMRHNSPVLTVNFDANLSKAIDARLFRFGTSFSPHYPWSTYFADRELTENASGFAIWHAHGMTRYADSIRLGMAHYMGSVQRARGMLYHGASALRAQRGDKLLQWEGSRTWLDPFFTKPIAIFGFRFDVDESFFRWLFLERARLYRLNPAWRKPAWYFSIDTRPGREEFLGSVGVQCVQVGDFSDIYEAKTWTT